MDAKPNKNGKKAEGDKVTLPLGEVASAQSTENPIQPAVPATPKQEVDASLEQQPRDSEIPKGKQPLRVAIVRDDELSSFEKKTVKYAKVGVLVSFLAFAAATAAAYFVFQQFKEMADQTNLLSMAAKQTRADSNASTIATAKQLRALQAQLLEQKQALAMDQRPWLKFELGGERPKDADPNNGKVRLLTTTAGQPIRLQTRITNIGKTTAERIVGTLAVQYVPKGKKPSLLLYRGKHFHFSDCRYRGGVAGWMWNEATLYPGEVSQISASRARCGKNGIVEDDPITESEKAQLDRNNAYILISGEVWYSDVFGVRHWTRFCEMSDSQIDPSVANGCLAFGDVDANRPKED